MGWCSVLKFYLACRLACFNNLIKCVSFRFSSTWTVNCSCWIFCRLILSVKNVWLTCCNPFDKSPGAVPGVCHLHTLYQ
jgi:hypothetical protein